MEASGADAMLQPIDFGEARSLDFRGQVLIIDFSSLQGLHIGLHND
jgi:hypothetical protein